MKTYIFEENLNGSNIIELENFQMSNIEGGILGVFLVAGGVYAGICAVAFGAGALYGLLTK